MTENVRRYMRLVADWLIGDEDNDDERNDLFPKMSREEQDELNRLIEDVFGEWL